MRAPDPAARHRAPHPRRRHRARLLLAALTTGSTVTVGVAAGEHEPTGDLSTPTPSTEARPLETAVPRDDDATGTPDSTPKNPSGKKTPTAVPRITIPRSGPGTFRIVKSSDRRAGGTSLLTYTVEVERTLPIDIEDAAATVEEILTSERGWQRTADRSFQRVSTGSEARILIASPATTDSLCAPLDTGGKVSCRNGELVVLNARRWAYATDSYRDDVASYRIYLVNHEVGHLLGNGHQECPGRGLPAPVMQQQTYGLDGCRRNVWPPSE